MAAGSGAPCALSLVRRPRRLRVSAAVRGAVRETRLHPSNLVLPVFVMEGEGFEEIGSMPGVRRWDVAGAVEQCRAAVACGVSMVALFPRIDAAKKNATGTHATDPDNLLFRALRAIKAAIPTVALVTDVALDPYTDHGHDGLLDDEGNVRNDETVAVLAEMAVAQAKAGADFVAPSDMMDGRVGAIRGALDAAGYSGVGIIAYSAKFASCFYGPFRDAVGSASAAGTHALDKRTYQMDPANRREALVETRLDEEEGADVLMVKPAGAYLDIIREVRDSTKLPVAAYQVSGEFAMLHAAAEKGWMDLEAGMMESLLAIRRAGADIILTYFAIEAAKKCAEL